MQGSSEIDLEQFNEGMPGVQKGFGRHSKMVWNEFKGG